MKIRVTHEDTTIEVDEAIDPAFKSTYETSHPSKLRGSDAAQVLATIKAIADEVIRMRNADRTPTT